MRVSVIEVAPQASADAFSPLSAFTEKALACANGIRENEDDFRNLDENILNLERFIFAEPPDGQDAVLNELSEGERVYLNDAYCRWETEIEYRYAHAVLTGEEKTLDNYRLSARFEQLLQRELSLLSGQRSPERILFIGSGPLPISAYYVHRITGKPVDCLDRCPEAVDISRRVIAQIGLSDSMRVFTGLGEDFNIRNYDLIIIALLAKPKRRIMRNVRKRAAPGCRVLCRTSFGLRTLVYEATPESVLMGFDVQARQLAEGEQTISTLLVEGAANHVAGIKLRWLTEVDGETASGISHLMNRVLERETTIGFPGPLDTAAGCTLMSHLNDDVKAGRRHVLTAEKDGTIVGQVILTPHHLPNCRHLVELSRGIIDPSYRGAGLALSAFEAIAAKCEELGGEVIYLDVRAGTSAAELWKSFGFVPFGKMPDYARVEGWRYYGLYMSQTVSALRHQLERIKLKRSGAPACVRGAEASKSATAPPTPSLPRNARTLPALEFADWRLKVYGINAEGAALGSELIDAASAAAARILPQPGNMPPDRYGVGFLVVSAGVMTDTALVGWWGLDNELFVRCLSAPHGDAGKLSQHSNMDGPLACVWSLDLIAHEREAWVKHVMRPEGADFNGYLLASKGCET
jgi:predicted GNAT family N-acyltransferase